MIAIDLTVIWAGIIAFAVATYVVMDGFDLAQRHTRPRQHMGSRRAGAQPAIHAGRRASHGARHPRLYRLGLLGLPGEGR